MGVVVVFLEVWMLARSIYAKVIPKVDAGKDFFEMLVQYTSKFWLFLLVGLAVMFFCMFFKKNDRLTKGKFLTLLIVGSACILYTLMLCLENFSVADMNSGLAADKIAQNIAKEVMR